MIRKPYIAMRMKRQRKESACAEFVMVNGVKVVCGEAESKHTPEAARMDVGMDHKFIPATWDAEEEPK